MSLTLYYLTGTGNSLWIARQTAERLCGSAVSIPDVIDQPSVRTDADTVGIVFPSYLAGLHGVPLVVERILGKLEDAQRKRVFAICNLRRARDRERSAQHAQLPSRRSSGMRPATVYTFRLPMNSLDYEHTPVFIETKRPRSPRQIRAPRCNTRARPAAWHSSGETCAAVASTKILNVASSQLRG